MGSQQVLFIQGGGSGVHDEWDHLLVDSLSLALGPSYDVRYPRMPDEGEPTYASWSAAIRGELSRLDDGAVVVAHSVGGTLLMATLAEHAVDRPLDAVVLLAAPFVGDGGWPGEDFEIPKDLGARLADHTQVLIVQGLADETTPPAHADLWAEAIPQAEVHRLPDRDHQLDNDLTPVAEVLRAS